MLSNFLTAPAKFTNTSLDPIQMLWIRGDLSRVELLSVRSFIKQGHPVHLYTYDPPANVPQGVMVKDASEIVPADLAPMSAKQPFGKGSMASFSDYFRLLLLYERGGWWADTDMVAIRSWTGFPDVVVASTFEKDYGQIANNFVLKFPKGHEIPKKSLKWFNGKNLSEIEFGKSGPLLLHDVLGLDGVKKYCQQPSIFGPVPWNGSYQLLRPLIKRFTLEEIKQRVRRPHLSIRFTKETVGIHLWNETWRAAGWDKNGHYGRTCLFEKLQKKFNPNN